MVSIREGFTIRPFDLVLTVTETGTDANANTSTLSWNLKVDPTSNYTSWSNIAGDNTYSVVINGVNGTGTYTFDFRTNTSSSQTIASGTRTVTHEVDGSKSVSVDCSSVSVVLGTSTPTAATLVLTDFVKLPEAPAQPTAVLATDRSKITVTSPTATSAVLPDTYEVQFSTNGGTTFSSPLTMTSRVYELTTLTVGATYIFQTRATSTEGSGPWSVSSGGIYVKPAGRRYNGTAWVAATTARRYNGTAWVDITVFRRYNGTSWVDIS
jgi:hypothetical protein